MCGYSCNYALPVMASNLSRISFAERSPRPSFDLNDDEDNVKFWVLTREPSFQYVIRGFAEHLSIVTGALLILHTAGSAEVSQSSIIVNDIINHSSW